MLLGCVACLHGGGGVKSPMLPQWCRCAWVLCGRARGVGKNRRLGCQLFPHRLPWVLGVPFGALTLAGEAGLTFPSRSISPPEEGGFCLLLSDCHADAYLLRSRRRIATEPAAFGSYHLGAKGVSFDSEQYPSEAQALQTVNKKQRLRTAKPSSWVREINKTTQILRSAPSLVFMQRSGSIIAL